MQPCLLTGSGLWFRGSAVPSQTVLGSIGCIEYVKRWIWLSSVDFVFKPNEIWSIWQPPRVLFCEDNKTKQNDEDRSTFFGSTDEPQRHLKRRWSISCVALKKHGWVASIPRDLDLLLNSWSLFLVYEFVRIYPVSGPVIPAPKISIFYNMKMIVRIIVSNVPKNGPS